MIPRWREFPVFAWRALIRPGWYWRDQITWLVCDRCEHDLEGDPS